MKKYLLIPIVKSPYSRVGIVLNYLEIDESLCFMVLHC